MEAYYQNQTFLCVNHPTSTFSFIIPNTKQLQNFPQSASDAERAGWKGKEPALLKGHISSEGQRVSGE